jgi:hypothetical protein
MTPEEKDAILYAKTGKLEKLRYCLDAGVSPNTIDNYRAKKSLLMYAACRGHLPIVRELLKRGADADYVDSDGVTALFQAKQAGQTKIVELLQERTIGRTGYDIEALLGCSEPWQGYCALHETIWKDYRRGRELNDYESNFQSLHAFLTFAVVGQGFEDMLRVRGYWCIPAGIQLFESVGEPQYAAMLRLVDGVIQSQAKRFGYDLEHDKPEDWKWDRSVSDSLNEIEKRTQLWALSQEEHDRLASKALEYVREHRQHFEGTA